MLKFARSLSLIAVISMVSTGCYVDPRYANEQSGALTGAVAGGILGATVGKGAGQGVATILGAMIGSAVGSDIGRGLDQQARDRANAAYAQAMRDGYDVAWQSKDFRGRVMPSPHVFYIEGRACKRFTMTIVDGRGGEEQVNGTSCNYGPKGWIVVDEQAYPAQPYHSHPSSSEQCHCH